MGVFCGFRPEPLVRSERESRRTVFEDEMLTIEDLAKYLKLKPQTIYKWAQTGQIPGAKFGKEWRFRRSAIEEWIDSRMAEQGSPPKKRGRAADGTADGNSSSSRNKGSSPRTGDGVEGN